MFQNKKRPSSKTLFPKPNESEKGRPITTFLINLSQKLISAKARTNFLDAFKFVFLFKNIFKKYFFIF
jgi:hypothetical protein